MGNLERALSHFQTAVKLSPTCHAALHNVGVLFTLQGAVKEGLDALHAAIAICPSHAESHNDLGVLLRDAGDVPGALAAYEQCLRCCPTSRPAGQNRLLAFNYLHSGEEQWLCAAHAEWGEQFAAAVTPLPPRQLTVAQLKGALLLITHPSAAAMLTVPRGTDDWATAREKLKGDDGALRGVCVCVCVCVCVERARDCDRQDAAIDGGVHLSGPLHALRLVLCRGAHHTSQQ
jgi:tetratricopeptide (TPR) repeat protein